MVYPSAMFGVSLMTFFILEKIKEVIKLIRKAIIFDDLQLSGVYAIQCLRNNKVYIGSSINIKERLNSHKGELRRNKHINRHLQEEYNKYGLEEFNFSILSLCEPELRIQEEQKYIDLYNSCDRQVGYNIAEIAGFPTMSEESRKLQSESLKKNTKFIENSRKFMIELHKDPDKHNKLIQAVKNSKKVKEQRAKWNASPEHRIQFQNLLEQVHNDPRIQDIVRNLAQSNIKKDSWRNSHSMRKVVQKDLNGNVIAVFDSLCEAARCGYSRDVVTAICKNKRKSNIYKGYIWEFEKEEGD